MESTTPSGLTFCRHPTTRTSHCPQHTLQTPQHHSQTPHQFPVIHPAYLYCLSSQGPGEEPRKIHKCLHVGLAQESAVDLISVVKFRLGFRMHPGLYDRMSEVRAFTDTNIFLFMISCCPSSLVLPFSLRHQIGSSAKVACNPARHEHLFPGLAHCMPTLQLQCLVARIVGRLRTADGPCGPSGRGRSE